MKIPAIIVVMFTATRHIYIILLFLILSASKGLACDCDYQGSFFKMASGTPFVALVKVSKYLSFKDIYGHQTPMSMEVEVIEVYKGSEQRKTITVWGDPGHLCRPYLSIFKEGQYYVVAFYPGDSGYGQSNEKSTDYTISNCGAYWLTAHIEKEIVSGDIDSKERQMQTMELTKFKTELRKHVSTLLTVSKELTRILTIDSLVAFNESKISTTYSKIEKYRMERSHGRNPNWHLTEYVFTDKNILISANNTLYSTGDTDMVITLYFELGELIKATSAWFDRNKNRIETNYYYDQGVLINKEADGQGMHRASYYVDMANRIKRSLKKRPIKFPG